MNSEQVLAGSYDEVKRYPFQFTGDGFEYFKIWIVNICLSIVTLGIYSAWAKVRTNRYFYSNTTLAGSSFEYLANPIAILKGRIIAVVALMAYSTATEYAQGIAALLFIVYACAFPWVITKALAFRAHNSAYRNIKFHFEQNYRGAYSTYMGIPFIFMFIIGFLAAIASIGGAVQFFFGILILLVVVLGIPVIKWWAARFLVSNSGYGATQFKFKVPVDSYVGIYIKATLLTALVFAVIGIALAIFAGVTGLLASDLGDFEKGGMVTVMTVIFGLAFTVAYIFPYVYVQAKSANILFGTKTLGDFTEYRFHCYQDVAEVMVLYITNTLGIIFTLGLFIPWAKVRMAKYKASRLCFMAEGDIEGFIAREQESVAALGEEMGEVFDLDIGL